MPKRAIAVPLLMLFAAPAAARSDMVDWSAAMRTDATVFRDMVLSSHPAAAPGEDPAFVARLLSEYGLAMLRADRAGDYPSYYFGLAEFGNAFNDGHLGMTDAKFPKDFAWTFRWPGFVTAERDDLQTVVISEGAGAPPVGAVLQSCDGIPAAEFAADRLGKQWGQWTLRSKRAQLSPQLFVRWDTPYRAAAKSCVFNQAGVDRTYPLNWLPIDAARYRGLISQAVGTRYRTRIGLSSFGDGGVWIGMGSFDSDPGSDAGKQLSALNAEIAQRAEALRRAPVIVFDLRGNNGGSSGWPAEAAQYLWGKTLAEARSPKSSGVDWRVSPANLAELKAAQVRLEKSDSQEVKDWIAEVVGGMEQASARGETFWHQADDGDPVVSSQEPGPDPVTGRVFVLTDYGCASACLDAVDIFTALGAVQVGQETSADTLYMDIRETALPSGYMRAWVPMKVYRGRRRASNETAIPTHVWTGALDDTDGLQQWIWRLR